MEDKVLIFEEAKIIFQNIDFQRSSSVPKAFEELRYCAGQLIHFNVEIPVSKDALQNVKVPHPARSPASSNLLRCFMRHLASTVDVKTSISVHHRAVSISTKDLAHETTVWFSCLLETSQLHDIYAGFFKTEPFLKEGKIYTVPFQMRLQSIPPHSDTVDLVVEIRQGQRLAPGWLSSPTRSDPVLFTTENNNSAKRFKQRLKVVHPPEILFQHKSVAGKQILLLRVSNNTSQTVNIADCSVLPELCPVKLCKQPAELQSEGTRKPCLIHGNMMKLLTSESPVLPVRLLPEESLSLMYNLHLIGGTDYLAREEIPFMCHLKWNTPANTSHSQSDILSMYSLPTIKIKQAYFVMSAKCKNDRIHPGDSFTVIYSVNNRLQDFLSVKLYWSPSPAAGTVEDKDQLESLKQGLLCCDPQVQLGACSYGSVMQAQVRFQALRPGLYEVCKHMKINLRYLIPSETEQISSPASHVSSHSGEDRLTSEEIWRERSGSGSSFREPEGSHAAERRLSLANKSYSVGDLVDKSPKTKSSEGRKLLLSMGTQNSNYEQILLSPGNFLKNSCELYVTDTRRLKHLTTDSDD